MIERCAPMTSLKYVVSDRSDPSRTFRVNLFDEYKVTLEQRFEAGQSSRLQADAKLTAEETRLTLAFMRRCLAVDPAKRATASELL